MTNGADQDLKKSIDLDEEVIIHKDKKDSDQTVQIFGVSEWMFFRFLKLRLI